MFMPRHIVTWGELLKQRRDAEKFDRMNEEEKCACHLFKMGSIRSLDTTLANYYWHEVLDEQCDSCPHKGTCRLFISEE